MTAQSQDDGGGGGGEQTVFDVGDPQGIDSMSPLIGVTVAAYEAWNIQYATLTDKAAGDFHTIPGLAESWKGSNGGKTWTYKLRDGLKWSDGEPLTAEDIAWTVNTSRDEEWINHSATTVNLDAEAADDTTLVLKSKVPDPKLPTMDVYILPKHIWGEMDAAKRAKYDGTDGVGSGPFVLEQFEKGQFARFKANPNYWGGKPAVDKVVLRKFNNPDAMVAALKTGELDAAQDIPGAAFDQLESDDSLQTVEGNQGSMTEVAINGGDGLKKPHPALLDVKVRQAIGHAIDKKTIVERVQNGHRPPRPRRSASHRTRAGRPRSRPIRSSTSTSTRRGRCSRTPATRTPMATASVRCPAAAQPLNFSLLRPLGRRDRARDRRVRNRLAARDRDRHDARRWPTTASSPTIIGKGDYDMFAWGWTPFVDPDPMLSLLHLRPGVERPGGPDELLQRRELLRPGVRQALRAAEGRARRATSGRRSSTRCSPASSSPGRYHVLYTEPETQAYVKDRFEGFVRQPAEIGPVLYSNTSPSYAQLKPVSASSGDDDDGGGGSGAIIAIVVAVVLGLRASCS